MKRLVTKVNVAGASGTYPFGDSQDDTGTNNGTPLNRERFSDWDQAVEKIFDASGIVANGLDDNATNGFQLYNAFRKLFRPWRAYTGLISQSFTNDPTVVVFGLNDVGTIVWTRAGVGSYLGTLTGAFVQNKTDFKIATGVNGGIECFIRWLSVDQILIDTYVGGAPADAVLNFTPIEIRIHDLTF
jgi:hypothetical protein